MKGMIFKKAFLIGCIFLLPTFMLAQLSWGCDDDKDKWDCDHHDKGDCHKYGKPCQPPKIQRVFLEYNPDSGTFIRFSIWGDNFDNGVRPVATLGGEFTLSVTQYSDDYIIATLPISEEQEFEFGDYRLIVSTCRDSECKDKICKDHGPNCKCKYCRDHCSKCKDKTCKDNEYKCRCKDRYSLTIPGPQGQAGPIALKIVTVPGTPSPVNEAETIGIADCGPGYKVTGGGFSCTACSRIIASKPLQEGTGWQAIGRLSAGTPDLQVYAICVQIQ